MSPVCHSIRFKAIDLPRSGNDSIPLLSAILVPIHGRIMLIIRGQPWCVANVHALAFKTTDTRTFYDW